MATEYVTLEVVVVVDEDGEYVVGKDAEEAGQSYIDSVCGDGSKGTRRVVLTVRVPLPREITLTGEVIEDVAETGELRVG